jgi:hypothetical protein
MTGLGRIGASPRRRRTARAVRFVVVLCLSLFCVGVAHAEGASQPGLEVNVGLAERPADAISFNFGLTPALPGSRALPPIRALRLVGYLGSLDLTGIPTCKPTVRSALSSGCTTPLIGKGRGYGYQSTTAEGDTTQKLHGTVRLYSGGQRGSISTLYAWASFPHAGFPPTGKSYVIPMTITRKGAGRSELLMRFPHPEGNLFSVAELLMSMRQSIQADGRTVPVTSVRCPSGPVSREVQAEASFYGPTTPIQAVPKSTCTG